MATTTHENDAVPDLDKLEARHKTGANWFYWIAGLSLVNSVVMLAGGQWGFIVGLGITQTADAIGAAVAEEIGAGIGLHAVVFAFDVFVAGIFVLVGDWLSVGFHAFALFCLFGGLMAGRKLTALDRPADPALTSQPITP